MQIVASYVQLEIELSKKEREAMHKLISLCRPGTAFEVLKDARIQVRIQVEVKQEKER